MAKLKIIMQDSLVNDFINGKSNSFLVETWPMSYKRFVETDAEGNIVLDSENIAVPKNFDGLAIISTDGKCYEAKVDKIEAFEDTIPSVDKDGKEILDKDGKQVMQPAVLLYKEKEWPQYMIDYTISEVKEVPAFDAPEKKNAPSIIKDNWLDYKEGRRGSAVISQFQESSSLNVTAEDQLKLIKTFNPNYLLNISNEQDKGLTSNLNLNYDIISNSLNSNFEAGQGVYFNTPTNIEEAIEFFIGYVNSYSNYYKETSLKERSLKYAIQDITTISINLYTFMPEFFVPYLFVMNFIALQRFFDKYNLELPETPSRYNWMERCKYYAKLCKIVYQFRIDNSLSPAELCALMYDYSQRHIEQQDSYLPEPSQAWLIGGTSDDAEQVADYRFWQANPDTKRGDILIHYEKYPTKAITAVWRAEENGIVDPFFWYYSNTYAGHKIEVPHITLDELKEDEFFKNPESSVGKLIKKNFQGVNGWTVSGDDYKHFLDIWKAKGCDTSKLPKLYAPELSGDIILNVEKDVSNNLLIPMLKSMGFQKGIDYDDEVPFKAGRGSAKRPDFCLHLTGKGEYKEAKVVIECKYYMKNNKEVEANFKQGLSYAKWGNAQVLVLCDKEQILVYERHNGSFDRNKFKKFYWGEVMGGNSDKFNELKKLLS